MFRRASAAACSTMAVITLGVTTTAAPGQSIEVTPLRPDGAVAEPFSNIRGVVALSDGRVMVADQREVAVYVASFDEGGRTVIGSVGEGPHEYKTPIGLFSMQGDTVLVYDLSNARYAIATPDAVVGVVTFRELGFGGGVPRAIDRARHIYWDKVSGTRVLKRRSPGSAGTDRAALLRLDEGSIDTVTTLTIPGPANPGPLQDWDFWSVSSDGWVAVVRNQDAYGVDWIAPDGRSIGGPVIQEQRQRIPRDERARLGAVPPAGAASFGAGGRSRRESEVHLPDRFPFARSIRASADGFAWVHRALPEDAPVYDVFDRDGERVAQYRFPDGRTLVGLGVGVAYAYREDDVGLQWLERYPLP